MSVIVDDMYNIHNYNIKVNNKNKIKKSTIRSQTTDNFIKWCVLNNVPIPLMRMRSCDIWGNCYEVMPFTYNDVKKGHVGKDNMYAAFFDK